MILSSGVVAPASLDGLEVKASIMDGIPYWVESYLCLVGSYLDGGSLYWQLPPCGVVLSMLCGTGMASDRSKVTIVPSVLVWPVRHVYSCQSRRVWLGMTSPCSCQGLGQWRGPESLGHYVAKAEGRGRV